VRRHDFIVIGGGPAGASAARRLAERGADVTLFERRVMPRRKPCGGALSEQAMGYLGFPLPEEFVDAQVFGARVHYGRAVTEARLPERIAVLVTRSRFDELLVSKAREAGAEVVWQPVTSLESQGSGVRFTTPDGPATARAAILCEGANRPLSRAVRQADAPDEQAFCLEAEVPVRRPDPFADARGLIDLYFTPDGCGYGWVFHHGSYYSVGIGAVGRGIRSPMAAFREFAAACGFDVGAIKPMGAYVPCGGLPRVVAADRILLAGDAAGFVDPFYGEGLAYAIRSGQLAAETLLEAAGANDFSAARLAAYAATCDAAFGRNLSGSLALARTMRRWPKFFFGLLASDPAVLGRYLHVPAMRLSYWEFTRWLLVRAPLFWLKGLVPRRSRV